MKRLTPTAPFGLATGAPLAKGALRGEIAFAALARCFYVPHVRRDAQGLL